MAHGLQHREPEALQQAGEAEDVGGVEPGVLDGLVDGPGHHHTVPEWGDRRGEVLTPSGGADHDQGRAVEAQGGQGTGQDWEVLAGFHGSDPQCHRPVEAVAGPESCSQFGVR